MLFEEINRNFSYIYTVTYFIILKKKKKIFTTRVAIKQRFRLKIIHFAFLLLDFSLIGFVYILSKYSSTEVNK